MRMCTGTGSYEPYVAIPCGDLRWSHSLDLDSASTELIPPPPLPPHAGYIGGMQCDVWPSARLPAGASDGLPPPLGPTLKLRLPGCPSKTEVMGSSTCKGALNFTLEVRCTSDRVWILNSNPRPAVLGPRRAFFVALLLTCTPPPCLPAASTARPVAALPARQRLAVRPLLDVPPTASFHAAPAAALAAFRAVLDDVDEHALEGRAGGRGRFGGPDDVIGCLCKRATGRHADVVARAGRECPSDHSPRPLFIHQQQWQQ